MWEIVLRPGKDVEDRTLQMQLHMTNYDAGILKKLNESVNELLEVLRTIFVAKSWKAKPIVRC
jgi:hypothetical protein